MMFVYAIKDNKTGLFYNRVHRDFRELSQNTSFYKNEKLANKELGIKEKIITEEQFRHDYPEYKNARYGLWFQLRKCGYSGDCELAVVKMQLCEVV